MRRCASVDLPALPLREAVPCSTASAGVAKPPLEPRGEDGCGESGGGASTRTVAELRRLLRAGPVVVVDDLDGGGAHDIAGEATERSSEGPTVENVRKLFDVDAVPFGVRWPKDKT